mmetsp:Transcript_84545/g.196592  ORF Transcript_84545/g.196592 Transcript_84545/m.196592 type:complete len:200 (-) Transcript_84545:1184-1783(-)
MRPGNGRGDCQTRLGGVHEGDKAHKLLSGFPKRARVGEWLSPSEGPSSLRGHPQGLAEILDNVSANHWTHRAGTCLRCRHWHAGEQGLAEPRRVQRRFRQRRRRESHQGRPTLAVCQGHLESHSEHFHHTLEHIHGPGDLGNILQPLVQQNPHGLDSGQVFWQLAAIWVSMARSFRSRARWLGSRSRFVHLHPGLGTTE